MSRRDEKSGAGGFADLFGDDPHTRRIEPKQRKPAAPERGRRRAAVDDVATRAPDHDDSLDADTHRGEVPPKQFTDLRMGRVPVETRIDLHGLDRTQAQQALQKAFGVATAAGRTCALVIHGKGKSSATGEATLKSALPRWLRTPPLDAWVRGFAPALPRDGGEGATYVLLRKNAPGKAAGRRR